MNIQEATLPNERQECAQDCAAKPKQADERSLIAQAKSGQSSAFGELYERHQPQIYRAAFRMLRNRQDAEDAVQRSFQSAFTNLSRFREDSAFSTWVTRIAINESLMMLRGRRHTTSISETSNNDTQPASAFDPADERPTPEQALAQGELRAAVVRATSRLRKTLRTVVVLREFHGLTSVETARRLGLSVSAVKARTFSARRCLRQHLKGKLKASRASLLVRSRIKG